MMKAVQLIARGQPQFIETPKPALQEGYAIIKVQRVSLCGSDIRWIHYKLDDDYPSAPGVTGHEMVGVIEAIGDNDEGFKVGDKVLALAPDHRAMAEYYLARIDHLLRLTDDVPIEHQVQAQQFGTVLYAAQRLPDLKDKTVAVIGQGTAGLWFNYVANERGAKRIIALDLKAYRLQLSEMYGATHTIHNAEVSPIDAIKDINEGQLPDVVIEAAGEKESVLLAVDLVKDSGFILYFGVPRFETIDYPFNKVFTKCITSSAIVYATREVGQVSTHKALKLIQSGQVDVSPMITHTFPFADVMQAYELHRLQDEGAVKIIIDVEA